jgi:hypothetical protein
VLLTTFAHLWFDLVHAEHSYFGTSSALNESFDAEVRFLGLSRAFTVVMGAAASTHGRRRRGVPSLSKSKMPTARDQGALVVYFSNLMDLPRR